jgi:hypothetical protein
MKCFRCFSHANKYVDEHEDEHTSNDIQHSATFIKKWKEHSTSIKKAQDYFLSRYQMNFEKNAPSALVVQKNVTKALAQIYVQKDEPNFFSREHGNLFQWVLRHDDLVLPKDGKYRAFDQLVADPRKNRTKQGVVKLPSDYKLMLQLLINNKWKDWVYIAESTRIGANYGVFAGRDFCSQTIIGFYMGPITWRANVEGGWEASPKELTYAGVPESKYALQLRDKDCRFMVVDPASIRSVDKKEIDEVALYMGMHYINNPCMSFKRGTPGYIAAAKDNNCLLLDDGCVQAIKKIKPNTELLTGYQRDQIYTKKCLQTSTKNTVDEDSDMDKKPAAKNKTVLKKFVLPLKTDVLSPKKRGQLPKKRGRPPLKKSVLSSKKSSKSSAVLAKKSASLSTEDEDSDMDKKPAAKNLPSLKKSVLPTKKNALLPKKRGRPPSKKSVLPPKKLVLPPKKSMPLLKKFVPPLKQSAMLAKKSAPLRTEVASKNTSDTKKSGGKKIISRKQTGAESKMRILPVRSAKHFNI